MMGIFLFCTASIFTNKPEADSARTNPELLHNNWELIQDLAKLHLNLFRLNFWNNSDWINCQLDLQGLRINKLWIDFNK